MPAIKPFVINADTAVSDSNPHSWLILSGDPPLHTGARCMVGTRRPEHRGRANSAAAFAAAKLLVSADEPNGPWKPAAYRHEVLLPHDVDDSCQCPQTLFESIDASHPPIGKALLGYITLTWTPTRLHRQWSIARQLAEELVHDHNVPALLIQHVPGIVANTARPHCHILTGPRTLSAIGWGGYVAALAGDRAWVMIKQRFDTLLALPS